MSRGLCRAERLLFVCLMSLAGSAGSAAKAQTSEELAGKIIYPRTSTVKVKVGNSIVAEVKDLRYPITVRKMQGDWLWIWTPKGEGWIARRDVVLQDEAVECFTTALTQNASDSHALFCRAWANKERNDLDVALTDYNELLRIRPGQASVFSARGNVWRAKKEYGIALGDYSAAIRLDPKNAVAYNNRGLAWRDQQDLDRAIDDFNAAVELDPKYAAAYNNRGLAWRDQQDLRQAISDFNEAIRLDPGYAAAYNNRGAAWHAEGQSDKAIADYTEAIRLDPSNATAFYNRGVARTNRWQAEEVLEDFDAAVRLSDQSADAYNGRAWLLATTGAGLSRDREQAVTDATRACQLSQWQNADMLNTLAAAHAASDDFKLAASVQQRALELAPSDEKTKYSKALERYKQHQPSGE